MGAREFILKHKGGSVKEAFSAMCEEQKYRYGHDSYSGGAHHCCLGRCKGAAKTLEEAYKIIEKYNGGEKYTADYIEVELQEYRVRTVERIVVKHGKARSVYVIYNGSIALKELSSKEEADKKARGYGFEGYDALRIKREVRYSNNEDDDLYRYKITDIFRKTKIKGTKNQKVEKMKYYIFFGAAPY